MVRMRLSIDEDEVLELTTKVVSRK